MMFEEIVYRGYGPHQRKGGGFSTLGVKSESALAQALADGWFLTLAEAIAAHDNKILVSEKIDQKAAQTVEVDATETVAPVAPVDIPSITDPSQDSAPTRAELVQKCQELGINVHHRHTDATLLKLINDKLGA